MLVPYISSAEKVIDHYQKCMKDPYARYRPNYYILSNEKSDSDGESDTEESQQKVSDERQLGDKDPYARYRPNYYNLSNEKSDSSDTEESLQEELEESQQDKSDTDESIESQQEKSNESQLDESDTDERSEPELADDENSDGESEVSNKENDISEEESDEESPQDIFTEPRTLVADTKMVDRENNVNKMDNFEREVNRLSEILESRKKLRTESSMSDNPAYILKSNVEPMESDDEEENPFRQSIENISIKGNTYICSICSASFKNYHDMIRHKKSKHEKINHICSQCGKVFSRKDSLRRHINSHN